MLAEPGCGGADVISIKGLNRTILLASAALSVVLAVTRSEAQTVGIAGKYKCVQAKVHGKVTSCSSAQLTLKNDGKFELRGWEGEYVVSGEYVELSDKQVKSKAKLEPGFRLVFRYRGKDGMVEVTYERKLRAPGGESLG